MEYLPFSVMRNQVAQYVQDTSSYRATRINDSINREYENVSNRFEWPQLKRLEPSLVTTIAGTSFLLMPKDFKTLIGLGQSTSGIEAGIMSGKTLLAFTAGHFTLTGPFEELVEIGEYAQSTTIATAEPLEVLSSSASDTTQSVRITGKVSAEERQETINLNGTTPVSGALTYDAGLSLLSIAATGTDRVGVVTVRGATSGTTYLTIQPYEFAAHHRAFRVFPNPDGTNTVIVAYLKRTTQLVNDADVPEIPVSQYLVKRVIGDVWSHMRKRSLGREAIVEAEGILAALIARYKTTEPRRNQSIPVMGSLAGSMKREQETLRIRVQSS